MLFQLLWFSEQKHFHIICRCNGRHLGFVISQSNSCTEWRMGQYSKHKYSSSCFVVFNFSCQHGKTVGSIKNCIFAPSAGEEMASHFQKAPKNMYFSPCLCDFLDVAANKQTYVTCCGVCLASYIPSFSMQISAWIAEDSCWLIILAQGHSFKRDHLPLVFYQGWYFLTKNSLLKRLTHVNKKECCSQRESQAYSEHFWQVLFSLPPVYLWPVLGLNEKIALRW